MISSCLLVGRGAGLAGPAWRLAYRGDTPLLATFRRQAPLLPPLVLAVAAGALAVVCVRHQPGAVEAELSRQIGPQGRAAPS